MAPAASAAACSSALAAAASFALAHDGARGCDDDLGGGHRGTTRLSLCTLSTWRQRRGLPPVATAASRHGDRRSRRSSRQPRELPTPWGGLYSSTLGPSALTRAAVFARRSHSSGGAYAWSSARTASLRPFFGREKISAALFWRRSFVEMRDGWWERETRARLDRVEAALGSIECLPATASMDVVLILLLFR